ncbi:TetR/AcrR family transcriptional regulator [Alteraurantiacibacter palmitatis]|uniref:TetR/AcrR family transcriptional regulator n=1 Tax=Alteraurantiacibacter palmitatis TaxID=2054628 RepID=A0ABV7E8M9_9SPHN
MATAKSLHAGKGKAPRSDGDPPKPQRGKGRPANGGVGREVIIAATRRLLAELPPSQITISSVAREAAVDPALVRYYFKDRPNLLLQAALAMIGEVRVREQSPGDVVDFIRERVASNFEFSRSSRYLTRLMIDELAASSSAEVRETYRQVSEDVVKRYGEALNAPNSPLRPGVNPFFFHITLVAISDFYSKAGPLLRIHLPPGQSEADQEREYRQFVIDLLIEGLKARG